MPKIIKALVGLLVFVPALAYAAPVVQFAPNLLPQANDKYDLGSTSPAMEWLHGYFNTLCIQGDCKTAWPTGGGGGTFPFTPTTWGGIAANSTSTLLQLLAGAVTSTSSVGNLTVGSLTATSSVTLPSGSITNAFLANSSITINGTAFNLGDSKTITAASSSLLSDSNTFSGTLNTFSNTIKVGSLAGLIGGNAGSLYAIATSSPLNTAITGNAGTATALAANGSNCSAGFFPLGIDASGNVETCTYAVATTSPWAANQFVYTNNAGVLVSAASSSLALPNTALANSSVTINTSGNITGCGALSLGGNCTLTAPLEFTPQTYGVSTTTYFAFLNSSNGISAIASSTFAVLQSASTTINNLFVTTGATTSAFAAFGSTTISGVLNSFGGLYSASSTLGKEFSSQATTTSFAALGSTTISGQFNAFGGLYSGSSTLGTIFGTNATTSSLFANGSTTIASALNVTGGNTAINVTGTQCLHVTGTGVIGGTGSDCAAGFAWPFTNQTYGVSTTTTFGFLGASNGIFANASSTLSVFQSASSTIGTLFGTQATTTSFAAASTTISSILNSLGTNWFGSTTLTKLFTPNASTTNFTTANTATIATSTINTEAGVGFGIATTTVIGAQFGFYMASSTCATGACTVDWAKDGSNGTGSSGERFIMTGNITLTMNATSSHPVSGMKELEMCQDGTGSRTLTYADPTHLRWGSLGTTTISSAANTCTLILFQYEPYWTPSGFSGNGLYMGVASSTSILIK